MIDRRNSLVFVLIALTALIFGAAWYVISNESGSGDDVSRRARGSDGIVSSTDGRLDRPSSQPAPSGTRLESPDQANVSRHGSFPDNGSESPKPSIPAADSSTAELSPDTYAAHPEDKREATAGEEDGELPQTVTGGIDIFVKNTRDEGVKGAEVLLLTERGDRQRVVSTATTSESGSCSFYPSSIGRGMIGNRVVDFDQFLPAGKYRIEIRASGYRFVQREVTLANNTYETVTVSLLDQTTVPITIIATHPDGLEVDRCRVHIFSLGEGMTPHTRSRFESIPRTWGEKLMDDTRFKLRLSRASGGRKTIQVPEGEIIEISAAYMDKPPIQPAEGFYIADLRAGGGAGTYHFIFPNPNAEAPPRDSQTFTLSGSLRFSAPEIEIHKARIRLIWPDERITGYALDVGGNWRIERLPPGRYRVAFDHSDLVVSYIRDVDLAYDQRLDVRVPIVQTEFRLKSGEAKTAGATFTIKAAWRDGVYTSPISDGEARGEPFRGGLGNFFDKYWTPGDYMAQILMADTVLKGAGPDRWVRFTIPETVLSFNHTFELEPVYDLAFQLVTPEGLGWVGAECRLVREDLFTDLSTRRNSGEAIDWPSMPAPLITVSHLGKGRLSGVPSGAYRLLVWTRSDDPSQWDAAHIATIGGANLDLGVIKME